MSQDRSTCRGMYETHRILPMNVERGEARRAHRHLSWLRIDGIEGCSSTGRAHALRERQRSPDGERDVRGIWATATSVSLIAGVMGSLRTIARVSSPGALATIASASSCRDSGPSSERAPRRRRRQRARPVVSAVTVSSGLRERDRIKNLPLFVNNSSTRRGGAAAMRTHL